jgi:4-hydroxybenzoate polyprenyltransferase
MEKLRAWLELFRVSNLPTVWTNVGAAWWLSGAADARALAGLLVGSSFVYVAGMTLNDVFDATVDRRERVTRPIPSGRISARIAGSVGSALLGAGAAVLALSGASLVWVAGLLTAVLAYDWLHKRSAWTAGLMALCRSILWGLPATLPGHSFTLPVVGWSVVLFAYIVGVTLLARSESAPATELPQRLESWLARGLILVPFAGAAAFSEPWRNWPAVPFALVAWWALRSSGLPTPRRIGLLLAAIPLIDAMAVAPAWTALLLAGGFPLCLVLQRHVPAS